MHAAVIDAFGPPEVLVSRTLPEPVAEPGQVLVAVELANVTFVDTQIRAGRPPHPSMAPTLPAVLGNGVGGRVVAVGDDADASLVHRRVVASLGGSGGYSGHAVAPAATTFAVPEELELEAAVALLADGRTAVGLIESAGITPSETVLVPAAAGGVGTLLVQLARSTGGRVVGAARGEDKLDLLRGLGVDLVVDYGRPGWAEAVVGGVDVAFDGVGGPVGRSAFDLVRPGGRYLPFGMASGAFADVSAEEAAGRGVDVVRGSRPSSEQLAERTRTALAEAVAGRLRPVVGQSFPLEQAAVAHARIEARATVGKTLFTVT